MERELFLRTGSRSGDNRRIFPLFLSAPAAVVILLFSVSADSASSAVTVPVGTQVFLPADAPGVLELRASGRSVVWVEARGEGIESLEAVTEEGMAAVRSEGNSSLRIPIPVESSEMIRVTIKRSASAGDIIVTSLYGIGPVVDLLDLGHEPAPAVLEKNPVTSGKKIPAKKETPSVESHENLPSRRIRDEGDEPKPVVKTADRADTVAPKKTAGVESPLSQEEEEIPLLSPTVFPDFHTVQKINLSSEELSVVTVRFYVPNRLPFRVVVSGNADARVSSSSGGFDRSQYGEDGPKVFTVENPQSDFFLVSVRGRGEVTISTEPLR